MKKASSILVILIVFNLIFINFFTTPVFADKKEGEAGASEAGEGAGDSEEAGDGETDEDTATSSDSGSGLTMREYKEASDDGIVNINGTKKQLGTQDSDLPSASSNLGLALINIVSPLTELFSNLAKSGGYYRTDSEYSAKNQGDLFTINSLVFGEYLLFNPKPYQKSTDLNGGAESTDVIKVIDSMKEKSIVVYAFVKRVVLLLVLPFVLVSIVKVFSSRTASDLAAWRKILSRWALCLFLIIFLDYILIIIDNVSDSLVDAFWKIRLNLESSDYQPFEIMVEKRVLKKYSQTGGVTSLGYGILFTAIVIAQILFFFKYAYRSFGIMILYVVAPVIVLFHSFNLMIGKESNILGDFFKDYLSLVFLQPFHAFIYLVFLFSLSQIAINAPLLGILLLYALLRATNIAKAMFGWQMGSSILG